MSLMVTPSEFGAYLRQLRQGRRQSLAGVAARAGVSERSLSRWENGVVRPRLPELEQVLRALAASQAERDLALALLEAPRGLRQQQREAAARAAALWDEERTPPGAGALLRAMRLRRHVSLAETASRLGVQPSSVSRWERAETLPAPEHLEALLDWLAAHPAEREALRSGLAGGQPFAVRLAGHGAASLEALRTEFLGLRYGGMWQEAADLMDLEFVSLEAGLWSLALRDEAARRVLGQVCAYHAFWLSNAGRLGEAGPLAQRGRRLCEGAASESYSYLLATIISARAAAAGGAESRARALRYLGPSPLWARHPDLQAWAMSEQGECLLVHGGGDSAVQVAQEARVLSGRHDNSGESWHRKLSLVRLLLRAGRGGAALDWLAMDPIGGVTPSERLRETLLWTQAHLAVGDRGEAHAHLARAAAAIRDHSLEQFRADLDRLAARL